MGMCRNETDKVQSAGSSVVRPSIALALMGMGLMISAGAAAAQDLEEDQPFPLTCEDGTRLTALFTENDVTVTLQEGGSFKLPFRTDDPFVLYTDGSRRLVEKGDVLEWTTGDKAPTLCSPEDGDVPTPFDQPVSVENVDLPPDTANPEAKPSVNCYRFPSFSVKEVDLGGVGAEKLAILPENAKCERESAGEKLVSDPVAGYFLGAKGNFVFFQSPDGFNGGLPYVVFDAATAGKLFEDSFEGADFEKIEAGNGKLVMDYVRTYSADCSIVSEGEACAQRVMKETGLGADRLPDCAPAYEAEKKRTPDYAKEIEQLPSVISYPVTMTLGGTTPTYAPRAGETSCRVPD